jgi:hypothetical protein
MTNTTEERIPAGVEEIAKEYRDAVDSIPEAEERDRLAGIILRLQDRCARRGNGVWLHALNGEAILAAISRADEALRSEHSARLAAEEWRREAEARLIDLTRAVMAAEETGYRRGLEEERAAIVTWLYDCRERFATMGEVVTEEAIRDLAKAIRVGDHHSRED